MFFFKGSSVSSSSDWLKNKSFQKIESFQPPSKIKFSESKKNKGICFHNNKPISSFMLNFVLCSS